MPRAAVRGGAAGRGGAAVRGGAALMALAGMALDAQADTVTPLPDLPAVISFTLRSAIVPCWSPPPGTRGEIVVRIRLSREMTVVGEPELMSPRPADPALEASVRRAILRCAPYDGLRNYLRHYDLWRDVVLRFDSRAP